MEGIVSLKNIIKWFLVTVFAGFFPVLIRLVFFAFLNNSASFQPILLSDIISWGLITSISIFHERDGLFSNNSVISLVSTYISIGLIVFFVMIYVLVLVNESSVIHGNGLLFKQRSLFYAGVVFCFLTFCMSILVCIYACLTGKTDTKDTRIDEG